MGVTSALVLLAVIWWLTFLIVLPFKVQTQGDVGSVEPGTHAGSPHVHNLRTKALITSGIAFVAWIAISAVILSGKVKISEMEIFQLESRIYDGKDE
jgi:predicted secreted protein